MGNLLTVADLAKKLRLNPKTVRLWAAKGILPVMRPTARKLLFDEKEVEAALRKRPENGV